ncbi:hypothetical protein D3C79_674600 [compost metagenome]
MFEQCLAVVNKWRHYRDFTFGQLGGEGMLFEDRCIGPAVWAIELGNQRFSVFDAHLIDAVLVAVECQNAGIAEKADTFHSVEDQVGSEGFEGVGHVDSCCAAGGRIMQAWYPT